MRIEQKAEKTLLLLLIDKPAALPITAIHAVDRWGKWPLILARPCGLATSVPSVRRGRDLLMVLAQTHDYESGG